MGGNGRNFGNAALPGCGFICLAQRFTLLPFDISRLANTMSDYRPISCEFHDVLESLATTRKPAQVEYRDADGALRRSKAVLNDVCGREGVEYVALSSGETVRLDRLVAVDGARLSDF
jgi:Rho-binding antiterminator